MIPKVIHYCWFGGKKKPKLVKDCIKSWRKYLPDYEIIEWNEKNSDLSHSFVKEAYRLKKWAFVSDFVRLKVIYEKGGIYLDCDMMVLKSFNDLLSDSCFMGTEDLIHINAAIFGAIPQNVFIKECVSLYDSLIITVNSNFSEITIPKLITKKFFECYNFEDDFKNLTIKNDIKIYPFQYFYSFPFESKSDLKNYKSYLKKESYAVHLWSSSWIDYSEFHYLRKREYKKGLQIVFKNIFSNKNTNIKYLKKIFSCFKESISYKNE